MVAAGVGESLGYVAVMLVIPVVGLILLVLGIRSQRAASRDRTPPYWQPPPNLPPGWHPPPELPLPPPVPHSRPGWAAVTMIMLGSGLLVLGLAGTALAVLGATQDSAPSARLSLTAPPDSPQRLQVGQCITAGQYAAAEMSPEPTDCADPEAVYELAYQAEGPTAICPDGSREDSGYAVLFNNSHTFCFVLNVAEGECFTVVPEAQLFKPVDCTDPSANSRIDRIIEGAEDLTLCPAGPQGAAFPQPSRTYCVVPPG